METTATELPNGSGYSISGSKTWITNSPIADVAIVWAKCKWDGKIRGFILERVQSLCFAYENAFHSNIPRKDMKGFETPKINGKLALRASTTGMILMDDVQVPKDNLLPEVSGLKGPFSCLNNARYGIAWGAMGALESCLELARTYALDRHQFGRPLASFQLIQVKMAAAATDISYGLLACTQAGRLKDSGGLASEMISMIKRQNCERALAGARMLQDM